MPFLLLLSDPFTPEDFLNKLIPNFWSFIINLLALIVTFVILYFVAYKPVKRYLKARKDYVKGNIEDSEKAKATMETREKETRHIVHDAEKKAYVIVDEARKTGEKLKQDSIESSKKEVAAMKAEMLEEVEREKQKAKASLNKEIVDVAMQASAKLLQREVTEKDDEKLQKDILKSLKEKKDESHK